MFGFFTEPDKLTRWLAEEASSTRAPAGSTSRRIRAGRTIRAVRTSCAVSSSRSSRPRGVVFTWGFENPDVDIDPGASTVEVTLEPEDGGTRVRLVHSGLPESELSSHSEGWTEMLERLAAAVEGP